MKRRLGTEATRGHEVREWRSSTWEEDQHTEMSQGRSTRRQGSAQMRQSVGWRSAATPINATRTKILHGREVLEMAPNSALLQPQGTLEASMESTETRRRHSSQQPGGCGGADHISGLPDDLLLLILAGLGCTAAAARTSVLSRRWRGLWASLRDISLRDVPFASLEAVLSRVPRPPPPIISLLEICVPRQNRRVPREHWPARADVASLLRAAARLAPESLVLALPPSVSNTNPGDLHLPCFRRAVSIWLESLPFVLRAPATAGAEFAALRRLYLLDCIVVDEDLDALLSCCPRLRVLELKHKATTWLRDHKRTVQSATLEELAVDSKTACATRVDIVAPALKELVVSFWAYDEMSISISAPMVERFWWQCRYGTECWVWSLEPPHGDSRNGRDTGTAPFAADFCPQCQLHFLR